MVTLQVTSELFLIKVPLVGLFQNILLLGTKPQAVLTLNSRQACVWTIEPSWFIISFLTYNCSFNPCAWQTWLSHCTTQMETPSQLRPLYHNCTQMVKIETKVKMTPSRKKQSEKKPRYNWTWAWRVRIGLWLYCIYSNEKIREVTNSKVHFRFCEAQHLKYLAHVMRLPNDSEQKKVSSYCACLMCEMVAKAICCTGPFEYNSRNTYS